MPFSSLQQLPERGHSGQAWMCTLWRLGKGQQVVPVQKLGKCFGWQRDSEDSWVSGPRVLTGAFSLLLLPPFPPAPQPSYQSCGSLLGVCCSFLVFACVLVFSGNRNPSKSRPHAWPVGFLKPCAVWGVGSLEEMKNLLLAALQAVTNTLSGGPGIGAVAGYGFVCEVAQHMGTRCSDLLASRGGFRLVTGSCRSVKFGAFASKEHRCDDRPEGYWIFSSCSNHTV